MRFKREDFGDNDDMEDDFVGDMDDGTDAGMGVGMVLSVVSILRPLVFWHCELVLFLLDMVCNRWLHAALASSELIESTALERILVVHLSPQVAVVLLSRQNGEYW